MKKITQCSCPQSNEFIFCERHNMEKSPHLVSLCKNREDYFQAWENDRGPGSELNQVEKSTVAKNKKCGGCSKNKTPTLEKAKSFAGSLSQFVVSGFKMVDESIKNARLEICNSCDRMNKENATCLECGCYLNIKTGWATEKCPLGKWDSVVQIQQPGCGGCSQKKS